MMDMARRTLRRALRNASRASSPGNIFANHPAPFSSIPSSSHEVETVFSQLVKTKIANAALRNSLVEVRRCLASAKDEKEIDSALSRNATLLSDPQSWILLLDLLRSCAHPSLAFKAFEWKKQQPNVTFSPEEYALLIRLAGKAGKLQIVKNLYGEMQSRGVCRTIEVENAYMFAHAYDTANCDCNEALKVFEKLRQSIGNDVKPNIVSYNVALSCYSKLRHLQYLEKTFEEMQEAGCSPSVETYNCLMLAYRRLGLWWRMEEVFLMMRDASMKPNALTFSTLIRGYAAAGLLDRMESVYEEMQKRCLALRITTAEAMVAAYRKAREFRKMENILFSIKAKRFQSSMTKLMIKSHASNDQIPEMEKLVDEAFRNADVPFSPELALIVIKTYFKKGEFERIDNFMQKAEECGWNLSCSIYNTLIYLHGMNSQYDKMEWYFQRMKISKCQPNLRTFQIMIRSYRKSNLEEDIQKVLRRMEEAGFDSSREREQYHTKVEIDDD